MRKYRGQAFAQSTTATYKSQLRAYLRFCLYFGYTPVPCSSHHLLRYVVFLARTLSASSIPCYLNVVRIVHLQSGFPNPLQEPFFKFQKDLLMRGIKRLHGNAVRQKLPITPDLLRKIHGTLDFTNSLDATFWAACVIAFFSFFRKSNLLIASAGSFDPQKHLRMCDIRVCKWGLLLIVRWSKTIQYRNRTLLVPVPRIEHSTLCPHAAVTQAFKLLSRHDSGTLLNGPAFVYITGEQVRPLTYATFTNKLKKSLQQCGVDSSMYSGHSFRRGGATFALNCGVPGHYIKLQGDWLSNAYERYLDTSLQYKLIAINIMSKSITH